MKNVGDLCILLKKKSLLFDFIVDKNYELSLLNGKSFYFGIDPTSDFLHVGHIQYFVMAKLLCSFGMKFIVLIGDFTVDIGDYSFRTSTRKSIDCDTLKSNVREIINTVKMICSNINLDCEIVSNSNWLSGLLFSDFLISVKQVNFKDSERTTAFRNRAESKCPMYFHELLYPYLQAYDFLYLFKLYGCILQIGGQDQFYNMVCGLRLIKRFMHRDVWLMSVPLLVNDYGEKLGKSVDGISCKFNSSYYHIFYLVNALLCQSYGTIEKIYKLIYDSNIRVDDSNSMLCAVEAVCSFIYSKHLSKLAIEYFRSGNIIKELISYLECLYVDTLSFKCLLRKCVPDATSAFIEKAVRDSAILINKALLVSVKLVGSMFIKGEVNSISIYHYHYLFKAI